MYSVNVPVPGEVRSLAASLAREMPGASPRRRGTRTLVCKRLEGDETLHRREARAREVLVGTRPFEAKVTGIDFFPDPPTGAGPVVYLTVDSPALVALHERLCETFDPIPGLCGPGYVPHVTIARGGSRAQAEAMADRDLDPVSWEITELEFWDAEREVPAGRVSLPA